MLTESMNDTNGSCGVGWREFGVVESDLLFFCIKIRFKDRVMLIFGLSDKFLMHCFYYYYLPNLLYYFYLV